jgi:hypothetical protein
MCSLAHPLFYQNTAKLQGFCGFLSIKLWPQLAFYLTPIVEASTDIISIFIQSILASLQGLDKYSRLNKLGILIYLTFQFRSFIIFSIPFIISPTSLSVRVFSPDWKTRLKAYETFPSFS